MSQKTNGQKVNHLNADMRRRTHWGEWITEQRRNIGLDEKYEYRLGRCCSSPFKCEWTMETASPFRMRPQSISSLAPFIETSDVTMPAHIAVRTHAVLISCSSDAHLPAFRRLAFEAAHEPPTISQHPRPRLLAYGSSTVITGVLTADLRRFVCLSSSITLGGVRLRVYAEYTQINWPLFIELICDAQAETCGVGLKMMSFARVIGKSRDDVSRE